MIDRIETIHSNDIPYYLYGIEQMNIFEHNDYFESSSQPYQTLYEEPSIVISPNDINYDSLEPFISDPDQILNQQEKMNKFEKEVSKVQYMDIDYPSDDEESTMTFYSCTYPQDYHDEEISQESIQHNFNDSCEEITVEYPSDYEIDYSGFLEGGTINPKSISEYSGVVLDPSKAPVLEALSFCIVMRIGAYQTPELEAKNKVKVTSLSTFLDGIKFFCTKKNPTDNIEARVKSLKLWFSSIPKRNLRDRPFIMDIKPNKVNALKYKINKMKKFAIEHNLLKPL